MLLVTVLWDATVGSADGSAVDPEGHWGALVTRLGMHGGMAVVLGALVAVSFLLPAQRELTEGGRHLLRVARLATGFWGLVATAALMVSAVELTGTSWTRVVADPRLLAVALQVPRGRALGVLTLVVLLAVLCWRVVRTRLGAQTVLLVLVVASLPVLSSGHADGDGHLVVSLAALAHVLAVATWMGGLVAMVLLAGRPVELVHALPRFSVVALGCYVSAGAAGVVMAVAGLGAGPASWRSTYTVLLALKVTAFAGLGVVGWLHRRRTLPAVAAGSRAGFVRLATGELLVMGVAGALGAVIAGTAPVQGGEPAPVTGAHEELLRPHPVALMVALMLLAAYLLGVRQARANGAAWPRRRALSWTGAVALAVALVVAGLREPTPAWAPTAVLVTSGLVLPVLVIAARPVLLAGLAHERPPVGLPLPRAMSDPTNAAVLLLVGVTVLHRIVTVGPPARPAWAGAVALVGAVVVGLVGLAPLVRCDSGVAAGHGARDRVVLLVLLGLGLLEQAAWSAWNGEVVEGMWWTVGCTVLLGLAAVVRVTSVRSGTTSPRTP